MRTIILLAALAPLGCGSSTPSPVVVITPSPFTSPGEQVENPLYTSWAKFPVGAKAVQKSVTAAKGVAETTVTTTSYTLAEVTEDRVVVVMQASTKRYDGVETVNPPERLTNTRWVGLPPGTSGQGKDKPAGESGVETVTIGVKSYPTKWYKGKDRNEAGEVFTQTWTSDDVPGQLVKSEMRIPASGKTTTIELIEVVIPQ